MLSAELKRKLIDPQYGNWASLTEDATAYYKRAEEEKCKSFLGIMGEEYFLEDPETEDEGYFLEDHETEDEEDFLEGHETEDEEDFLEDLDSNIYPSDKVVLWLNILLPDNRVYECGVTISYLGTDESFIKEFKEYAKNFSVDDYAEEAISRRYSLEDRKYMAEYVYRTLTNTIRSLSEDQNICREGVRANMLSKEFLESGVGFTRGREITQRILPDGKVEVILTLAFYAFMELDYDEMDRLSKECSDERHCDAGFSIVFDGTEEDFIEKLHSVRHHLTDFGKWLVIRFGLNRDTAMAYEYGIKELLWEYP